MANVRIAQLGQTAVNRPFYEVLTNGKRYAFATGENGRVYFKGRAWLQSLGVNSLVAGQFQDGLDTDISTPLKLDYVGSTDRAQFFQSVTLGSGLAFVSDFTPLKGWVNMFPAIKQDYNV